MPPFLFSKAKLLVGEARPRTLHILNGAFFSLGEPLTNSSFLLLDGYCSASDSFFFASECSYRPPIFFS